MSRNAKILLVLIILLAGFFRFYDFVSTPPGLYPDEAMNGNNALEALRTGDFKVYYPENNGREGLFINIQAAFLDFFGVNEPWVLRLPSAIFGLLTVLGIFFLTRELFRENPKLQDSNSKQITNVQKLKGSEIWKLGFGNSEVALFASFLMATSVWHIIFSRIGFRAIMAPFFIVWTIYFLLRAFHNNSKFHIPNSIFGGVLFGLGMYTYIAYRVSPVLIFIIILWYWRSAPESRKRIFHASCFFILASFIVALPLGLYYLNNPADFLGRTAQVSVFSSPTPLRDLGSNILKTTGMFNFEGDGNWRHNFAGRPELFWPVGIFLLAGLTLGIRAVFKKPSSSFSFLILFSWAFLAALPVFISNEGLPHALRAILMIPPVIILAAAGGIALYNSIKKRTPSFFLDAAAVIVIVIVMVEPYTTYFTKWARNPNVQGAFAADYVALGREINALPADVPKYVVVEAGGVDVRGVPMPAQTVMFITDSFTPEKRKEKNIHYVLPGAENPPLEAKVFHIK
ncbi:MAG: glycosyltransferase family 39 protein [Candidatus Liptonbacteria bacterium]|nr:glycosyltransferase family 39 protein [Candidatus Liptonbacteria bacterium]